MDNIKKYERLNKKSECITYKLEDLKNDDMILNIDPELRDLLPPLTKDEFNDLEKLLLEEGCKSKIALWNGFIADGHNRYNICTKHNIPFETYNLAYKTKEEVKDWMIRFQLGRRNITLEQTSYLRGLQYEREKKKFGAPEGNDNASKNKVEESSTLNSTKTAQKLAEQHKVSERTIREDGKYAVAIDKIAENVGTEIKNKILNKEISVSKENVIKIADKTSKEQKELFTNVKDNKIILPKKEKVENKIKKVELEKEEEYKEEQLNTNNIDNDFNKPKKTDNEKPNSEKSIKEIIKDLKTPKYIIPTFDFINELECVNDNLKQFIQDAHDNFFEIHDISEIITQEEKYIAIEYFSDLIKQLTDFKNKINNIIIKGE